MSRPKWCEISAVLFFYFASILMIYLICICPLLYTFNLRLFCSLGARWFWQTFIAKEIGTRKQIHTSKGWSVNKVSTVKQFLIFLFELRNFTLKHWLVFEKSSPCLQSSAILLHQRMCVQYLHYLSLLVPKIYIFYSQLQLREQKEKFASAFSLILPPSDPAAATGEDCVHYVSNLPCKLFRM